MFDLGRQTPKEARRRRRRDWSSSLREKQRREQDKLSRGEMGAGWHAGLKTYKQHVFESQMEHETAELKKRLRDSGIPVKMYFKTKPSDNAEATASPLPCGHGAAGEDFSEDVDATGRADLIDQRAALQRERPKAPNKALDKKRALGCSNAADPVAAIRPDSRYERLRDRMRLREKRRRRASRRAARQEGRAAAAAAVTAAHEQQPQPQPPPQRASPPPLHPGANSRGEDTEDDDGESTDEYRSGEDEAGVGEESSGSKGSSAHRSLPASNPGWHFGRPGTPLGRGSPVPLFSAAGFEPPARGKGAHGFTPLHTPAPSRGATPVACVLRRAPPKHIQGSPSTADASGAASTAPGGSEEGAQKKVKVKTVRKLRLGTASKNERSVVALDVPEQSLRGGTPSQNSPVRRAEVATPDEKTAALLQAYLRNPHHEMREADDSIAAGVSSIAPLPLRGAIAAKKRAQKAHAAVDRAIEEKAEAARQRLAGAGMATVSAMNAFASFGKFGGFAGSGSGGGGAVASGGGANNGFPPGWLGRSSSPVAGLRSILSRAGSPSRGLSVRFGAGTETADGDQHMPRLLPGASSAGSERSVRFSGDEGGDGSSDYGGSSSCSSVHSASDDDDGRHGSIKRVDGSSFRRVDGRMTTDKVARTRQLLSKRRPALGNTESAAHTSLQATAHAGTGVALRRHARKEFLQARATSAHARQRRVAALRAAETERRKKRKHVMQWAVMERGNEAHFQHIQARRDREAAAAVKRKETKEFAAGEAGAGLLQRTVALSAAQKASEAQQAQRHVRLTHHTRSFQPAIPAVYSSREAAAIYEALAAMPTRTPVVGYRVRRGPDVLIPEKPLWDDGGAQWQPMSQTLTSQALPQKFSLPAL
jgi:hypothetical protein